MGRTREGICALCKEHRTLIRSHILPEFLYQGVYDDLGRFAEVTDNFEKKPKLHQSGIKEHLLCFPCDNGIIGGWEKYVKENIFDPEDHLEEVVPGRLVIRGLDYPSVKLFLLSLLWRISVSESVGFKDVSLDIQDEEHLRYLLLDADPGPPHHYPCLLLTNPKIIELISGQVIAPEVARGRGMEIIRFSIGGLHWNYFTTRKPRRDVLKKRPFLTSDGTFPVFLSEAGDKWMLDYWSEIRESGNVARSEALFSKRKSR